MGYTMNFISNLNPFKLCYQDKKKKNENLSNNKKNENLDSNKKNENLGNNKENEDLSNGNKKNENLDNCNKKSENLSNGNKENENLSNGNKKSETLDNNKENENLDTERNNVLISCLCEEDESIRSWLVKNEKEKKRNSYILKKFMSMQN